jgi:hypothetical protein
VEMSDFSDTVCTTKLSNENNVQPVLLKPLSVSASVNRKSANGMQSDSSDRMPKEPVLLFELSNEMRYGERKKEEEEEEKKSQLQKS